MSESIAEQLAAAIGSLREPPREVRETAEKLVIDIAGLCVAARGTDYVKSALVDDPSNYSGGAAWRLQFDVDI